MNSGSVLIVTKLFLTGLFLDCLQIVKANGASQEHVLCLLKKPFQVKFHLLPAQRERSPSGSEQLLHTQAGLGCRNAILDENMTHRQAESKCKSTLSVGGA